MTVQPEQGGIVESASWFEHLDIPILIDHMGRPSGELGPDHDPNIAKVRQLLERGNFWVMLSLGEKLSRSGAPWDDVVPLARAILDANPERCVWGSDWPHPISRTPPPNDAELLELLYRYARDEGELRRILVDNPSKLFGFDPVILAGDAFCPPVKRPGIAAT
jgi:predicted TIM-barrel fold metal-dependent hydrolase